MEKTSYGVGATRGVALLVFFSVTAVGCVVGLMSISRGWLATPEIRFLAMAIFGGYLGGCVDSLSFLMRAGFIQQSAVKEHFWVLVMTPLMGSSIAIIFYFLLRGGLVNNIQALNASGVLALSVLAGMFARTSVVKLRAIAQALFETDEDKDSRRP